MFKFPLWGRAWRSHPTSPTPASGSTAGRVDLQDFLAQRSWPKDENSSRWPGDFEGRQGTPVLWGAESSGGKSSRVGDKGGPAGGGQCDGWRIHLFPDPPSPPFSLVVVVGGFRSVLKNGNLGICSYESSSSPYIDGRWGVWDLEVILYTFRHLAKKQGTARKEKPQ